jgi:hypothetical protein
MKIDSEDVTIKQIIIYAIPWVSLIAISAFSSQGIVIIVVALCAAFSTMMGIPDNRKEKDIDNELNEEAYKEED